MKQLKRQLGNQTTIKLFKDQQLDITKGIVALESESQISMNVDKAAFIRTAIDELLKRLKVERTLVAD